MSYITKEFLHSVRTLFIKEYKSYHFKPSHVAESLASGYGYKSYASCLQDIKENNYKDIAEFNNNLFIVKLFSWYTPKNIKEIHSSIEVIIKQVEATKILQEIIDHATINKDFRVRLIIEQNSLIVRYKNNIQYYASYIGFLIKEYLLKNDLKIDFNLTNNNGVSYIDLLFNNYSTILSPEQLNIPEAIIKHCNSLGSNIGINFIGGATGSGKTTTLTSLIQNILNTQIKLIISYENPIEFRYHDKKSKSSVLQFEKELDNTCLKYRPDIVVLSETRNLDEIKKVLNICACGHIIFSTIHTGKVSDLLNRILDHFPHKERDLIASESLELINIMMVQRIISDSERKNKIAIFEYLIINDYVRNRLRNISHIYWKKEIQLILNEYSGKQNNIVECESFTDNLIGLYKQNKISLSCLKQNM